MIVFQVSLNFDPVREIFKIRCQIYILMKKMIILREQKACGNERHDKETEHIHASTADLLHTVLE